MLPRIIVHCTNELPSKHLWKWLHHEFPGCTSFELDTDSNLCLYAESRYKKLTSLKCIKSLAAFNPKVSIPLLYEMCVGLDVRNDTALMLLDDLGILLGTDFGHDYVRWYTEPKRLAFDTTRKIAKAKIQAHSDVIYYLKSTAHDNEWLVLWKFSEHLRRLLVEHLQVKVMGNGD